MKKSILLLATVAAFALCLSVASHAATQVYDLKADWSDTQNPNGTWAYRAGNNLLVNNPFPWVWVGEANRTFIKTATEAWECHSEVGDVLVLPGVGANVLWTAPENGTIDISGSIWPSAFLTTGWTSWILSHNAIVLSSGADNWGLGYGGCSGYGDRTAQTDLSLGSGGAAVLQNIRVAAGDQLVLQFGGVEESDPPFAGNETGVNFRITLTPDSGDPVTAIEDLALTVVAMNLQNGIENSLDSKLDAAVNALIDANFNNDGAACNSLAAFISAVEAQRTKKITSAQADQLLAAAQQIKAMLSCGN